MAAQPLTMEFLERHPLREFEVGARKFVPLRGTNLQVDYDDGFWSVSLSPLDAIGCSQDFLEARLKIFEYINFLWNEYVLCQENDLGETGKMQRELLLELFSVS